MKRGEAHNLSCLKSSVKFPQSVMIWAAVTSAGVGPLCFIKSKVYQEILENLMQFFCWPWYYCVFCDITNMPDLNPIWKWWDIFKRKMRNSRSNNPDELKAVPQADRFHTSLMLEFVLKEPRPSIECINELILKNWTFLFYKSFFFFFFFFFYILRYWMFDFLEL